MEPEIDKLILGQKEPHDLYDAVHQYFDQLLLKAALLLHVHRMGNFVAIVLNLYFDVAFPFACALVPHLHHL